MSSLLIKTDKENAKLLAKLAKSLGANVLQTTDEQFEDFALGKLMDSVKTNETVSRTLIMESLKG